MKTFERTVYYFILIAGIVVFSCEENGTDTETAPEIPPESTFILDFSDFDNNQKSDEADLIKLRTNFTFAVIHVAWWNLFIAGNMIIPVASFVEAFNHEPVREGPGWWIWSYNFNAGGVVHKAELHGKVSSEITWEMYISKEGEYTDFLWYTGQNDLLITEGYWLLKRTPADSALLFRIDWERNLADSTGQIKYSVINEDEDYYDSYIQYGNTENPPFDAFYDIHLTKDSIVEVNIEWSSINKDGRIKALPTFKDSEWHCWDTLQYDIDCD